MIPITTRDQAKLAAQRIKRFEGVTHAKALDIVASHAGYSSWHAMAAALPDTAPRGASRNATVSLRFFAPGRAVFEVGLADDHEPYILECDSHPDHHLLLLAAHFCYLVYRPSSGAFWLVDRLRSTRATFEEYPVYAEGTADSAFHCYIPLSPLSGRYDPPRFDDMNQPFLAYGPDPFDPTGYRMRRATAKYMDAPYRAKDIALAPWSEASGPHWLPPSVEPTVPSDPYFILSPAPIWALNILNAVVPPCSDYLPPDYGPQRSVISYTAKHLYLAFAEEFITPILGEGGRLSVAKIRSWIRAREAGFHFPASLKPNVLRTWGRDVWKSHPEDSIPPEDRTEVVPGGDIPF